MCVLAMHASLQESFVAWHHARLGYVCVCGAFLLPAAEDVVYMVSEDLSPRVLPCVGVW